MKRWGLLAAVAVLGASAPSSASAQLLLRHCVRHDALCWHCVDVRSPLSLSCSLDLTTCPEPNICVTQDVAHCYASVTRCCSPTATSCESIPDCDGAGSACGDVDGDGIYETCTSLTECPGAVPSMLLGDGGVPALDAGTPPLDAGTNAEDAGTNAEDASEELDAATARVDAATGAVTDARAPEAMDGASAPATPPDEFGFAGGGGCACAAAPGSRRLDARLAPIAASMLLLGACARRARRRRARTQSASAPG